MLINMSKKAMEERVKELKNSTFIFNKEVEFKNSKDGQKKIFDIYIAASFDDLTIHYSDEDCIQDYNNIDDMVEIYYIDNSKYSVIVYSVVDSQGKTSTYEYINIGDVSTLINDAKKYIYVAKQEYIYLVDILKNL